MRCNVEKRSQKSRKAKLKGPFGPAVEIPSFNYVLTPCPDMANYNPKVLPISPYCGYGRSAVSCPYNAHSL